MLSECTPNSFRGKSHMTITILSESTHSVLESTENKNFVYIGGSSNSSQRDDIAKRGLKIANRILHRNTNTRNSVHVTKVKI